jgi:hypothetical protein
MTSVLARRRVQKRAGSSAARDYERLKRDWQKRNRVLFAVFLGVATLIVGGTLLASLPHVWPWVGGFVGGASLAFYVALRESPPTWIENYQVGAWGEAKTAKALQSLLGAGWVILHDLNRINHNLDHVLVGPGGVFVLDTKNWPGTAQVERGGIVITRLDGKRSRLDLASKARAQGVELNQLVRQRCGLRVWVTAVIVLWADFPDRVLPGDRMSYVHGDYLVEWLRAQPARLNAAQIEQIAAALEPGQRRRPNTSTPPPAQP